MHTFLLCMPEHWRVPGERRVAHEELNWDSISLSVLLRTDSAGFPAALSQSQCLRIFNVWTLQEAETYSTLTTWLQLISEPTAVRLQHMSNLYIWFCKKKSLFRMSMYDLNFKLFLIFFFLLIIKSTELFWEKSYVNIWFISYPGYKRFMCGYSIKTNVDWREILWDWGSSITFEFALWMYHYSLLDLVECSSAC